MLFDGIKMVEGTQASHLTLANKTQLPATGTPGEMILLCGNPSQHGAYIYCEGQWKKLMDSTSPINSEIVLTGEVAGRGTNNIQVELSDTGVAGGTYGSEYTIPVLIIGDDGRVTGAQNRSVMIDASAIISGSFENARISLSNVKQHEKQLVISESQIENGTQLARITDHEQISGTWTFAKSPKMPYPQTNEDAVSKAYVDSMIASLQAQINALK